jgi:hypothetical protein
MVKDVSREGAREGTRKLMLGGSALAAAVFVGMFAWFAVPDLFGTTDYLGRPPTGADKGTAATTVGTDGVAGVKTASCRHLLTLSASRLCRTYAPLQSRGEGPRHCCERNRR